MKPVYKCGDVVLSFETIFAALGILEKGVLAFSQHNADKIAIDSLAKFVEAIVIHERLFVPDQELWMAEKLNFKHKEILNEIKVDREFVDFVHSTDEVASKLRSEIDNRADEENEDDAIPEIITPEQAASITQALHYNMRMTYYFASFYNLAFRSTVLSTNAQPERIALKNIRHQSVSETAAIRLIEDIAAVSRDALNKRNRYLQDYFSLDIPLILNYVLERAMSKEEIIPIAIDVRNSKEAVALRSILSLLDSATSVGDDKTVVQIIDELQSKVESLGKKLNKGSVSIDIAYPQSVAINFSELAKLAQERMPYFRKRHLVFIEQLYNSGVQSRSIDLQLGKLL